jgi:hypothetical protein
METLPNPSQMMRMPLGPLSSPFGGPPFVMKGHPGSIINPALLNEQE